MSRLIQKSKDFWRRDLRKSPEFLVARWKRFVSDLETEGHTRNWLIDDYWILLETREAIHNLGIDDLVSEADQRFRALLTSTEIKHRRTERKSDYDFWNYGYPKNATGFFYEQIKIHILGQSHE
jgi:hypothetical protein